MAEQQPAVLVVGAGPAGIACAYFLQQRGVAYEVVDQAAVVASTWAQQYPSLRLNTTRFYSHLPGAKFPLRFRLFPTAAQYHSYLERFAARHRLNIRLGVTVLHAAPEGDGWRVERSDGVSHYAAVVAASGRYPNPYRPRLPGLDAFSGTVMHAHEYRGPGPFAGQRVLVVGSGPTGVDLACELPQAAARPVLLAIRSGLTLKPRWPLGLPKHVWMLLADRLPARLGAPLERRIEGISYRNTARCGIKAPDAAHASGAAGTRGPELINAVRRGDVRPVDAPARFEARAAVLADGSRLELDAVILATGYRPALAYLDIAYETDDTGLPRRQPVGYPAYRGYLPHTGYEAQGHPGLYIAGVFYQGRGALHNFNVEGAIIADQIARRLARRPAVGAFTAAPQPQ